MDEPRAAEFEEIRRRTEALWADDAINPNASGFQMRPGTRWNPGLAPDEIDAYERALGVRFPESLRCMLSVMNGTAPLTINVYGSRGHPAAKGPGVYAYPRDVALVREWMDCVAQDRDGIVEVLAEQGFALEPHAALVPIYSHRILVCGPGSPDGPVLSILGTDAIVYGGSLVEYLQAEFYTAEMLREAGWNELRADLG